VDDCHANDRAISGDNVGGISSVRKRAADGWNEGIDDWDRAGDPGADALDKGADHFTDNRGSRAWRDLTDRQFVNKLRGQRVFFAGRTRHGAPGAGGVDGGRGFPGRSRAGASFTVAWRGGIDVVAGAIDIQIGALTDARIKK
jgi:hypothetical protein